MFIVLHESDGTRVALKVSAIDAIEEMTFAQGCGCRLTLHSGESCTVTETFDRIAGKLVNLNEENEGNSQ